jgi:hypothetical protein
VAVSGWFVLLVAVGAVPVVLLQGVPGLVLWGVVLAAVITIDLVLAGSPRALGSVPPGRGSRWVPVRRSR